METKAWYNPGKQSLHLTASSPINIALVKYWGKVHEDLIIPANSSLSITIDQNDLCSKTLVELVNDQTEDIVLVLNGKPEKISSRLRRIMDIMRSRSKGVIARSEGGGTVELS